jgi:hypothetical protein
MQVALGREEVVHDARAVLLLAVREDHLGLEVRAVARRARRRADEPFDLREDLALEILVLGRGLDDELGARDLRVVGRARHAREHLLLLLGVNAPDSTPFCDLLLELLPCRSCSAASRRRRRRLHAERAQHLREVERDVGADLARTDDGDLAGCCGLRA